MEELKVDLKEELKRELEEFISSEIAKYINVLVKIRSKSKIKPRNLEDEMFVCPKNLGSKCSNIKYPNRRLCTNCMLEYQKQAYKQNKAKIDMIKQNQSIL